MPTAVIASFAQKTGMSIEEAERRWEKAKQIAKSGGRSESEGSSFWAYVTGIFKKAMGIKKESLTDTDWTDIMTELTIKIMKPVPIKPKRKVKSLAKTLWGENMIKKLMQGETRKVLQEVIRGHEVGPNVVDNNPPKGSHWTKKTSGEKYEYSHIQGGSYVLNRVEKPGTEVVEIDKFQILFKSAER